ncbi:hypothetical protein Tco_0697008 [Tanacetum coccineum]
MEVLHIFDRQDLFHLYDLVMKQYSESTPEGIELILWGDLKIMMESSIEVTDQGDFWNDQQDWEIVTWRLYEACGVCILEFKDGTVIHMLVERKYPLSKELLQRMLDFGLEVEVESTAALDLIRRIAKDVKETLRSDQDLSECLNTSSMKFKESTPKKHEVKQVQQSCLGEDCWELYIPDLVLNSMAGSEDDIPPPPPPPSQTPTQQTPHTVSTIKLPILKKGEYDIWAMKMEHYLAHTDYPIWEVIQRGNGPVSVSTDINGLIKVLPPKTTKEILARERERERKARTTLLMALPEDHLAKFHKMTDAKEMWEAIKSRFGGNDESKKMQKYILKQQFEGFSAFPLKMQIRSSLVFESDAKGSTASSSSTQNMAFVSENTSSTNDVSTAYGVSNSSGHNSQYEHTSSYSDMYGYIKNHIKTIKNEQTRTRESEECKKKPKIQSRSQKNQASVKSSQKWSTKSQPIKVKTSQ